MKSIFTKPKVCKASNGVWYVYFRFNGQLKKFKKGINYIQDLSKREIEANALAAALYNKLKEDWNPNIPYLDFINPTYSFNKALQFALDKKKPNLAPKTISDYTCTINFITTATTQLGLRAMPVTSIQRSHIKLIMERAAKNRKWSNKAYNKHLNHLKAVLSELIQWDVINFNPAHKINNLPVEETEANIPATPRQHKRIKEMLETQHPNFKNFIATLYHTGMRPTEILQIKINMIDLFKQQIILQPKNTKGKKRKRIVPINNHLIKDFINMNLDKFPTDFYLFGSYRIPGTGNIGKHEDFIPGPTAIKRDTATRRWETIVKKGLGIQVNMYAEKHRGANSKILAGMPIDALRELYGHTSKLTTEIYAKAVKEVYRKQIMENSPEY